jgi:tetratricopeptide (TPR) repeat protein
LHVLEKDFEAAFAACDDNMARVKDNRRAAAVIHNLKGSLYQGQNDLTSAEDQFKKAIQSDPNYLQAYYALARLYLAGNQEDRAIAQFKAGLEKDPDQTMPHMFLGTIYQAKGDTDLAEQHYRQALEINPEFAPAANNIAYLLVARNGDLNEALSMAQKAKQIRPDDPFISDTLGWVYYQKGLYDNAVSELTFALDKLPENATVKYHLGMVYFKMGEKEKARDHLEAALRLDSSFDGAQEAKETLAKL